MNFQKIKKCLFCFFLFFSFFFPSFLLAQRLELEYPQFPSIPSWTGTLEDFLRYFYQIFLGIGVILTLVFLLFGGFIYLTSLGHPTRIRKGKEMMTSAFLGLFILFASYAILSTIDPSLTIFNFRIFQFTIPEYSVPDFRTPEAPPGCYIIPLHGHLKEIQRLEQEGLDLINRLEPLISNATSSIESLYEIMENCTCSIFQVECLKSRDNQESWHCPAWCPPDQGDPCPPEIEERIAEVERRFHHGEEIIALLENFGFHISDELRERIFEILDEGFQERDVKLEDFVKRFIEFLENELGDLTLEQEREIRELVESSLSVLLHILEALIRKLTELKKELDKFVVDVIQCREDPIRQLWICSEAKYKTFEKDLKCKELDFYCCI